MFEFLVKILNNEYFIYFEIYLDKKCDEKVRNK
jgi:hypothetical protein